MDRIWACVVCYRAPAAQVQALAGSLRGEVECVLLMDNSPDGTLDGIADRNVRHIPLNANLGTGGAMNRAWDIALAAGADAMISFDQDSEPPRDLVARLAASLKALQAQGHHVAAIGPSKVDPRSGLAGRVLLPVGWLRRHAAGDAAGPVEADHVITSGCLIPAAAYRHVGPYDEALFLDYVDMDWCQRARSTGYSVFVDTAARLTHRIGDSVFQWRGRMLSIHQPPRNYLLLRNHLLLWRKTYIARTWLTSDLLQVMKKLAATLLLASPRLIRLRWIARGLRDGLRGQGGAP